MPKNFAITRPVNPQNVEPRISLEQLWKGLELKVTHPQLFLAMATGADLATEGGNTIRKMTTKSGVVVQERIIQYDGAVISFDGVDTELRVTNTISYDQNNELLLTFTFVGGIPGQPGQAENSTPEELNKIIGGVIQKTIDVIRDSVQTGSV